MTHDPSIWSDAVIALLVIAGLAMTLMVGLRFWK